MNQLIARTGRGPAAILAVGAAAILASSIGTGCGSSKSKSTTSTQLASTSSSQATAAQPSTATSPTVTSGPVRATLHGANHTPASNKSWTYSVRVTDAAGHPLAGTASTEFVFNGIVVGHESPGALPVRNGVLNDSLTFPPAALGHPLTVVVVVHTSAGSVALGWPVSVKQ